MKRYRMFSSNNVPGNCRLTVQYEQAMMITGKTRRNLRHPGGKKQYLRSLPF